MFHSPTSVDSRAVQLGGVLTFFVAVACTVFAGRYVAEWVVSLCWCPYGALIACFSGVGVVVWMFVFWCSTCSDVSFRPRTTSPFLVKHITARGESNVVFAWGVFAFSEASTFAHTWLCRRQSYRPSHPSRAPQVLGLFVDFCLRTAGLPTPFAMLVNLPFAGTKPKLS